MLISAVLAGASICPGPVTKPVDGPVVASFAPSGGYAGHWGIDLGAAAGTPVRAPAPGTITFAGSVAGMRAVSIDHGAGWKTSLSYLGDIDVALGQTVAAGALIGSSGWAHGQQRVHLSLRIDGSYVDPMLLFICTVGSITEALHLLPPTPAYAPASHATRPVWRHF